MVDFIFGAFVGAGLMFLLCTAVASSILNAIGEDLERGWMSYRGQFYIISPATQRIEPVAP